jgi:hypothetical protein
MADPDIIASAVANKASFRMTIPIHIAKKTARFRRRLARDTD